jgi:hypothetical protein
VSGLKDSRRRGDSLPKDGGDRILNKVDVRD